MPCSHILASHRSEDQFSDSTFSTNSTHHDTPEVWIRPRAFAEDLDRLVVGETEHPIFARKVLQHRLTHANQDWGEPAVFIVFDKCVARGASFSAIEVAFDF